MISEGIHYRYSQGQTVGGGFAHIGDVVVPLAEKGLAVLRGDPIDGTPATHAQPTSMRTDNLVEA